MNKYLYKLLFIGMGLIISSICLNAQIDKKEIRHGNKLFKKGKWQEAEIDYRKALVKDSTSFPALYNLSNTLYREKNVKEAIKMMDKLKDRAVLSNYGSDYFYNRGDMAIAMKDWQGAVNALKQSLLRNPGDMNAKENYIYAEKMLENQKKNQKNNKNKNKQNQDNKNNKDKNKQNQDNKNNKDNKDKNKQNQDKKNKDNKDKNKQNQDKNNQNNQNKDNQNGNNQNNPNNPNQKGQGQQPKISPQQAQQMLKAIQAKEKATQDKVKKEKAAVMKTKKREKNW